MSFSFILVSITLIHRRHFIMSKHCPLRLMCPSQNKFALRLSSSPNTSRISSSVVRVKMRIKWVARSTDKFKTSQSNLICASHAFFFRFHATVFSNSIWIHHRFHLSWNEILLCLYIGFQILPMTQILPNRK